MKEKEGRRVTGGHNVVYNPTNFDQNPRLSLACVDHPEQRTEIKRCFDLRIIRTLISKLTKLYTVTDCHNFMMDSDIFDNRDNTGHLYNRKYRRLKTRSITEQKSQMLGDKRRGETLFI